MLTRASLRAFSTAGLKVVNNVAKQQFTASLLDIEATLSYEERGKNITFIRTDVPKQFQGKGVGKLLAQYAFNYALDKKLDVLCKCHFLADFYENNTNKYKSLKIKFQID